MWDLQDDGSGDMACFRNTAGAAAELAQVVQGELVHVRAARHLFHHLQQPISGI
jgi:hypothetical protein